MEKNLVQERWFMTIPSWDAFETEIKLIYQDKTREADAEWHIETFTQGQKHIADFLIKFMVLVAKAQMTNTPYLC